jgi:CheY-like chemotaxis protein
LQAMKRLRNTPETRLIPVIALTSNATQQDIEAGLHAGFDGYLTKPIVVSELMKTIQTTLDNITDPI